MKNPEIDYAKHPELDDRLREPLDEEERELMDPDSWDWDNVIEGIPVADPHMTFEVRLSSDELSQIEPAAIAKGMTVIAFMKQAALRSARLSSPR
jgi:hypothetical protein